MSTFLIGDTHFSEGCNKPMDIFGGAWTGYRDKLISSLSVLQPEDVLVLAGDFSWGMSLQEALPDFRLLDSFPGKKLLIKGNHDRCHDARLLKCFAKVCDYLEVEDGEDHIVLSHYPIPCFKNHFYGWLHFYGHVHTSFEWNMMEHDRYLMETLYEKQCRMYNVGAMLPYMDYTPRTKEEILVDGDAYFHSHAGKT